MINGLLLELHEKIVLVTSCRRFNASAVRVMVFMGSKDVTSAMLAAIFVFDVTTSTAHLYDI